MKPKKSSPLSIIKNTATTLYPMADIENSRVWETLHRRNKEKESIKIRGKEKEKEIIRNHYWGKKSSHSPLWYCWWSTGKEQVRTTENEQNLIHPRTKTQRRSIQKIEYHKISHEGKKLTEGRGNSPIGCSWWFGVLGKTEVESCWETEVGEIVNL